MDRLLRLISKKHPAYKEFAHLFSETIFIRDGEDEANVREILKKKEIRWEYAIRAKKGAINRRVRRYIPSPEKLVKDLLLLFTCFQDLLDADGKKFFTKDARKQAAALVETARLGFLSDPPGMAVYYLIGRDKNGLNLYRTIRGTNSVEGGVHKQIRRIFGSLNASLVLTEAILGNWFHRRNRRVCGSFLLFELNVSNTWFKPFRLGTIIVLGLTATTISISGCWMTSLRPQSGSRLSPPSPSRNSLRPESQLQRRSALSQLRPRLRLLMKSLSFPRPIFSSHHTTTTIINSPSRS